MTLTASQVAKQAKAPRYQLWLNQASIRHTDTIPLLSFSLSLQLSFQFYGFPRCNNGSEDNHRPWHHPPPPSKSYKFWQRYPGRQARRTPTRWAILPMICLQFCSWRPLQKATTHLISYRLQSLTLHVNDGFSVNHAIVTGSVDDVKIVKNLARGNSLINEEGMGAGENYPSITLGCSILSV